MMPMPACWRSFIEYWCLSQCQGRHLWLALTHAKDTRATALRQQMCLFHDMETPLRSLDTVAAFFTKIATPQRIVETVEALEKERQLSHREANALMTKMLARVDAHGKWT